jgi:hypothetical protein
MGKVIMSQLENTISWLNFIQSENSNNLHSIDTSFYKESLFVNLLNDLDTPELAPFRPLFTEQYLASAKSVSSNNSAPISVHDGIQTVINMCRSKSEYDPLDQKGKGSGEYFTKFTNLISGVPFLTLEWSEVTTIEQKSHNADSLIDSFLNGFRGVENQDKEEIRKSLKELVKAALSYSKTKQTKSIFSQNIFSEQNKNTELEKVSCAIYSSIFEISQTEHKGNITFYAKYSLIQASYSLNTSTWNRIKNSFAEKEKESVDAWIHGTTTPENVSSGVKALCLESSE